MLATSIKKVIFDLPSAATELKCTVTTEKSKIDPLTNLKTLAVFSRMAGLASIKGMKDSGYKIAP